MERIYIYLLLLAQTEESIAKMNLYREKGQARANTQA